VVTAAATVAPGTALSVAFHDGVVQVTADGTAPPPSSPPSSPPPPAPPRPRPRRTEDERQVSLL